MLEVVMAEFQILNIYRTIGYGFSETNCYNKRNNLLLNSDIFEYIYIFYTTIKQCIFFFKISTLKKNKIK